MSKRGIAAIIAIVGLGGAAAEAVTPKNHYLIGKIDCVVRGVGLEGADHLHDVSCEFEPGRDAAESYFGIVETVKNGVAAATAAPMQWLVFAARRLSGAAILSGDYNRAQATLGFGFDGKALVREAGPQIVLQPVAGLFGVSRKAAADVIRLELRSLSD